MLREFTLTSGDIGVEEFVRVDDPEAFGPYEPGIKTTGMRGVALVATVREAFLDLMRKLGYTTVFGNPGSTEETFLERFPDDLQYVLALQEASVVAIADGYAQSTRRPAMVNLHTAAGTGHAMTSIMTAAQNRTPLVITAGQQTREMLLVEPWLTNPEPTELPKPWVKWAYQPVRPQDAPGALLRAHLTAQQPPRGPVFLSLPLDDWSAEIDHPVTVRTTTTRVGADPDRLQQVANALDAARTPALVIGGGVDRSGAWHTAVALAERLVCTVYAAPSSERVGFPENHPLYAGALPFAIGPLAERLTGHDVVVVVGAPVFRYYPYVPGDYLPAGTALWHVTDDPAEAARAPVGDAILADPGLALDGLLALLGLTRLDRSAPVPASPLSDPPSGTPLAADALFAILDDTRRPGTVLVEESPSNLAALHARWKVTEPASFFTFASGALGWGLPAAVGIALGERATGRDRPVLAVIGEGSLQYSVQALWTAAQQQLPLTIVVPDNADYAILKAFAKQEDAPGMPGLELPGLDVVRIAEGFGVTAVRADTAGQVRAALRDAARHPGPTLVDVPIRPDVPPLL